LPLKKGDSAAMRLLVVEDNRDILANLADYLALKGYEVDCAQDGLTGLHLAATQHYDLIVLDVMLPGIDGRKVLQSIRATGNQVPVLFLTARSSVDDRVQGLELGADDYLIKPFAFSELLARVRTMLRRGGSPAPHDRIQIADLELDLARRRAIRAGHRITLTSKEFALLELLARRQGEVLPRSLIASQVWDMNFDSDTNVIDVAIRRLRAKIDDSYEPKLIQTVRGMGYTLDIPDA